MNQQHQSIYDAQRGTYIAVSEHSKRRGKRSKNSLISAIAALTVLGSLNAEATLYSGDISGPGCLICGLPADDTIVTDGNLFSGYHAILAGYLSTYTGPININANSRTININTAGGKTISTPSGSAIIAYTSGRLGGGASTINIENYSKINSGQTSIFATTNQIGDLNITNHGTLNANAEAGINAHHWGTGNTVVTSYGAITAANTGITTEQETTAVGNATINSFAAVTGGITGLSAYHLGAGNISMNANAEVKAGRYGVVAQHYGTGAVNIQTYGDISANNSDYFYANGADNYKSVAIGARSNSAPISIKANAGTNINSVGDGIAAASTSGAVTIDNAANITTTSYVGDYINGTVKAANYPFVGHGINVSDALAGSTITNSGNITVQTGGLVFKGGNAVENITSTAGTLTGDIDLSYGDDALTLSGGALKGSIFMGSGNDTLTVSGTADVSAAPQLDGYRGPVVGWLEMPQDGSTPDLPLYEPTSDTLNLKGVSVRGFTAASNDSTGNDTSKGVNLTSWETINVQDAATLKLSSNLFTLSNTGTLNIDGTSTLDLKGNSPGIFTINGNVNNSGTMTMQDGAADDVTTITGNYTGAAGSQFNIDTVLNGDASATDKLVVNGNTNGTTALNVTNAGGTGAQTVEGIQVVQVDGASDGTFTMTAPVQAGSYEYTLQKNGISTPTDGDWYLRSKLASTVCIQSTNSNCGSTGTPSINIYRPGVAAYTTAQTANADAGFTLMSTLHQRMAEQKGLSTDKAQTWGRIIAAGQSNDGHERFGYDQTTAGVQFGRDLLHRNDAAGTMQRAGITAQYTHSSIDARDRVRPLAGLGEDTGSLNSAMIGLGGYYTRMNKDGAYLDVVGQANHLHNKFSDSYGGQSTQNGWQAGLSVEVGKPVANLGSWKVEPQAQLSYLYGHYNGFSDTLSHINSVNAHNLRARLGVRLNKDTAISGQAAQYYGIANITHDFVKPKSLTLYDLTGTGSATTSERFDKTSFEIGGGLLGQIGKATYLYADARYQRSFKGNKEGAQFNVGMKASF